MIRPVAQTKDYRALAFASRAFGSASFESKITKELTIHGKHPEHYRQD